MKSLIRLTHTVLRPILRLSWLLGLALVILSSASVGHASIPLAQDDCPAGSICVNTFADVKQNNDGVCSLREAIIAANADKKDGGKPGECPAGNGADTIILPSSIPGETPPYVLSLTDKGNEDSSNTGDLDISSDMTIIGAGAGQTTIDANSIFDRAFHVLNGNVTISGVTITRSGPENFTGNGAGIHNSANLTLKNVTVDSTHAEGSGGGIYNQGVLTLFDSTVSHSTAGQNGGGIANASSGSTTLNNSTISGNFATVSGGGIFNAGILTLNNATISFNQANVTGGGGLFNSTGVGTVNIRNTIVAENTPSDCFGTLFSLGYNLIQNTTDCSLINDPDPTTNFIGVDPLLAPLNNNGGQTQTHALLPGSPAIDAGNSAGCFGSTGQLTSDQRGQPRPEDGNFDGVFVCDIGAFEAGQGPGGGQNVLTLIRAFPDDNGNTFIHGLFDGVANATLDQSLNLEFFASCDPSSVGSFYQEDVVKINADGYFEVEIQDSGLVSGDFVTATSIDPDSNTPLQSNCISFTEFNEIWPFAQELFPDPTDSTDRFGNQYIDSPGQARWYKFKVEPNSDLTVILSGPDGENDPLPADYDLTLYRDIGAAFEAIVDQNDPNWVPDEDDLVLIGAQSAGSSFNGSSFNGSSFNGSSFNGSSFNGSSFNGSSFNGSSFNGSSFNGSSFNGSSFNGSSFNGSSFNGSSFNGSSFNGSSFNAEFFGGGQYSQAFSDAQDRSLLAISAIGGTAPENIFNRTWDKNEYFYVRVSGKNGAFSLDAPFRVEVNLEPGGCSNVDFDLLNGLSEGTNLNVTNGGYKTIILTDQTRGLDLSEIVDPVTGKTLKDKLDDLAAMVNGVVVNVDDGDGPLPDDKGVQDAKDQADNNLGCPFAKNVVAQQIKQIIDAYKDANPLEYVVIVGVDDVIPFFRYPDQAELAPETIFIPPVLEESAAQAALRLNYLFSDDGYIAKQHVEFANSTFPIIDLELGVGRLLETPQEIAAVIDAFLADNGVVQPQTSLVTGYDFLEDGALAIENQLRDGTGVEPDDLITPQSVNIVQDANNPAIWDATDMSNALLNSGRHDLIFLAGHFSDNKALAADYQTVMSASEVAEATVDLQNTIIFSVGCHIGYNVPANAEITELPDGTFAQITGTPDWAQAFAGQGATLIGGTGYQYGETEAIEYNERLHHEFSKKLRDPSGSISIGHALNKAKLAYITQVPQIRGLHEKALLETAIFGLPMLTVEMSNPLPSDPDTSIVDSSDLVEVPDPNNVPVGLQYADIDVTSPLNEVTRELVDIANPNGDPIPAKYLTGTGGGLVTYPLEPFLPLEVRNVTPPDAGTVLRGVGFRGGTYDKVEDILALTGAPTTEALALHFAWQTNFLYPTQTWNTNYLGTLIDGQQRIMVTPAQHIAGNSDTFDGLSDRWQYGSMNFRLFYSGNLTDFSGHTPALSAPPTIMQVSAIPNNSEVFFRIKAVGDPAAGMQSVWIVWTDTGSSCPCTWQSVDLSQRPSDSTIWEGSLPLNGKDPANIRYIVQAANYFGRLSLSTNEGVFYTPGLPPVPDTPTQLTLEAPTSGVFLDDVEISATLETGDGQPLSGQPIEFKLGSGLYAQGITEIDSDGKARATVTIKISSTPDSIPATPALDPHKLVASFAGQGIYKPASALADFTINPKGTELTISTPDVSVFPGQNTGIVVTLKDDDGLPLRERGVVIIVTDNNDNDKVVFSVADITNLQGEISLGAVDLPTGEYTVTAYFNDANNPLTNLFHDLAYQPNITTVTGTTLEVLESPCTTTATPEVVIWSPNHRFETVNLGEPSGPTINVTGIRQDEPVGNNGPDGRIVDNDTVELRAERDGNGNGRVYHILFTADDGQGFTCTGDRPIRVVEHDQNGDPIGSEIDDGPLFDSTEVTKFAPEAVDDTATTDEENLVSVNTSVLANDIPAQQNDTLSVTAINGDSDLQVTLASGALVTATTTGTYTYDPNGQFEHLAVGAVATDTFEYTVSDDDGDFDTGTVIISITGLNDPPVAVDDSATTSQDSAGITFNVVANDTDVDGNLHPASVTVSDPANGSAVSNGDGTVTYTPDSGFSGPSDSFTYTVCDDGDPALCDTATVSITVNTSNQPPVAVDDTAETDEDSTGVSIDVTFNDVDDNLDLDLSTVVVVSQPVNGTANVENDGTVKYIPNPDFSGQDTFTYKVSDTDGLTSNAATVIVTVTNLPDAPVANDDQANLNTDEKSSVSINVVANDTDVDGDLDPKSVTVISDPENGSAVSNGDGTVSYTPTDSFLGTDSFEYQVCDSTSNCDTATVTVTVTGNQAPVAVDDTFSGPKGNPILSMDVVNVENSNGEHDYDPDGSTEELTVIEFTQGSRGTVTANDDGTLKYEPNSNYKGDDSFTYIISDGKGGTAEGTVTIIME